MKMAIAKVLVWAIKRLGHHAFIMDDVLMNDARKAVAVIAGKGPSGEYRRHQALAALMKKGHSQRDAALAIELAVRDVPA